MKTIKDYIENNSYPGRGIIVGMTENGKAAIGYFISGRSANSRNRVFEIDEKGDVFTKPFDESKVEDPRLIIYRAVAHMNNALIVTNGDQTDTVAAFMERGDSARDGLMTREFEPDAPNYTPRISAVLGFVNSGAEREGFGYEMSILKSADSEGSACNRFFFDYTALPGKGHFIHTYEGDGNPLPTFCGEPRQFKICEDIGDMTAEIWNSLDKDNRISLYVEYIDLKTMKSETRLINKNEKVK